MRRNDTETQLHIVDTERENWKERQHFCRIGKRLEKWNCKMWLGRQTGKGVSHGEDISVFTCYSPALPHDRGCKPHSGSGHNYSRDIPVTSIRLELKESRVTSSSTEDAVADFYATSGVDESANGGVVVVIEFSNCILWIHFNLHHIELIHAILLLCHRDDVIVEVRDYIQNPNSFTSYCYVIKMTSYSRSMITFKS